MSLHPSYSPSFFYYQVEAPSSTGVFECLFNAHEMEVDHYQLMRHLR
jgi:hypothetical protein